MATQQEQNQNETNLVLVLLFRYLYHSLRILILLEYYRKIQMVRLLKLS